MPDINLSRGLTRYNILGNPDAGDWTLVFGGFHFPRNCDAFFASLAERLDPDQAILAYDYWGRGGSDCPEGPYDAPFYVQQAHELLEKLELGEQRLTVLGYSFGGAVASHFIASYPDRVKATVYSGAWAAWEPFPAIGTLFCKWGLGGLFYWLYQNALRPSVRKGFMHPKENEAIIDRMFEVENAVVGENPGQLRRALLSTFRNFSRNTQKVIREQALQGRPVLLAWGVEDRIAPFRMAEEMHAAIPNSSLVRVHGNHNDIWLVPELMEPFQKDLLAFLKRHKMQVE